MKTSNLKFRRVGRLSLMMIVEMVLLRILENTYLGVLDNSCLSFFFLLPRIFSDRPNFRALKSVDQEIS